MVDHLPPAGAGVLQKTRKHRARQCVGREGQRNDGQGPAHRTARGLKQGDEKNRSENHIRQAGIADPESQIVKHIRDVEHAGHAAKTQQPVHQWHATGRQPAVAGDEFAAAVGRRKDQEYQAQHKGQMHAAVRDFLQQAEACGVVMKARQRDQQPLDDDCGGWHCGPKTHLGVELLFKLLQAFVIGGN